MGALLGFLAIVGGIAALMWRLSIAIRTAKDIAGIAKTAANLPRKIRFQQKAGKSNLQNVSDPREAAVILMLSVARAAGEVTLAQKDAIQEQIVQRFDFSLEKSDQLLRHCTWLSQNLADPSTPVTRMSQLIQASVSHKELLELEDMLRFVAMADGDPNAAQKAICDEFAVKAGL